MIMQCFVPHCDVLLQTDFLNSVIVDLQRKNESLQLQLDAALTLHNRLSNDDDDDDIALKYVIIVIIVITL